jgi:hypothetical protein
MDFTTPDFGIRILDRQLRGTNHSNKGKMFSFFKSYYVDDTAFIFLSRGEK